MKNQYRPEIDGLRTIAVVSVILYHAELLLGGRDYFTGGFIGVDVFFVISGYLITRIILDELNEKASFSVAGFYERRARRILPALFAVMIASIPAAWFRLFPADITEYAQSILSALFFGSNFFFYFASTEYGADSALLKPFLHTWSLGVEEQFYIIFPLFALLAYKFFKSYFVSVFAFVCVMSFSFAVYMETQDHFMNFFFPFGRFWEIGAGSFVAIFAPKFINKPSGVLDQIFPIFGVFLILYSIVFFEKGTPHPGLQTLVPILGVVIVILFCSQNDLVGRILGSKVFVFIGLISYSLYIWHFPIFAFARGSSLDSTNIDKLYWIALTVLLAIGSYYLVEKPFRRRDIVSGRLFVFVVGAGFALIISFCFWVIQTDGLRLRYQDKSLEVLAQFERLEFRMLHHPDGVLGEQYTTGYRILGCNMRDPLEACRHGDEGLVFLGDSFVGHYERALIDQLDNRNLGFVSFNYEECPFILGNFWFGKTGECPEINARRREVISQFTQPKIFVVSANEGQFWHAKKAGEDVKPAGVESYSNDVWDAYAQSIRWLTSLGHKVVLIKTLPAPTMDSGAWLGANPSYLRNMNFPEVQSETKPSSIINLDDERYAGFAGENVIMVDPVRYLCDLERDVCFNVRKDYGPLHNRGRHLSYLGAALVAQGVEQLLMEEGWIE